MTARLTRDGRFSVQSLRVANWTVELELMTEPVSVRPLDLEVEGAR